MLLTVSTTRAPATDLGHLLHKHPDRVQVFDTSAGPATVLYPEAREDRCTAALLLEVDVATLRDRRSATGPGTPLGSDVSDRPYAASSLLAVALARVFGSAMKGRCDARPELAAAALPLELHVPALPCRGGPDLAARVFGPLGWEVHATAVPLDDTRPDWGDSPYVDLVLRGELRLADALQHLYVLLPVLDDAKHYWVGPDEVDKLVRAGTGWLARHPERRLIAERYLRHHRSLTRPALARLAEIEDGAGSRRCRRPRPGRADGVGAAPRAAPPGRAGRAAGRRRRPRRRPRLRRGRARRRPARRAERPPRRRDRRVAAGARAHRPAGPTRHHARPAAQPAEPLPVVAAVRRRPPRRARRGRARRGRRARRPVPAPRAGARGLRRRAAGQAVVVTTPNVEYDVRYPGLQPGELRHHDHRFEWTRAQFRDWTGAVAERYAYTVEHRPVGPDDPEVGPPTQLGLFTRAAR